MIWLFFILVFLLSLANLALSIRNAVLTIRTADRVKLIEARLEEPLTPTVSRPPTVIPVEPVDPPVSRNQKTPQVNIAALGPKFDGNFGSNIGNQ